MNLSGEGKNNCKLTVIQFHDPSSITTPNYRTPLDVMIVLLPTQKVCSTAMLIILNLEGRRMWWPLGAYCTL
jgi:hypothetical protein